jgi:hypothetical protein
MPLNFVALKKKKTENEKKYGPLLSEYVWCTVQRTALV